jgi:ribonucleotide reductase beta subunit family protein with ferritin-like domain
MVQTQYLVQLHLLVEEEELEVYRQVQEVQVDLVVEVAIKELVALELLIRDMLVEELLRLIQHLAVEVVLEQLAQMEWFVILERYQVMAVMVWHLQLLVHQ